MTKRVWDPEGLRFKRYLGPILNALRTRGGSGTPRQVFDQIVHDLNLPAEALNEVRKSGVPRLANQISWARLYLKFEGLVDTSTRGVWSLTDKGRATHLSVTDVLAITSHWDKVFGGRQKPTKSRTASTPSLSKGKPKDAAQIVTPDESARVKTDESGKAHRMGDAAWLIERGFQPIGSWSPAAPKLQRRIPLTRERAVYAFVVNDRISYIGKATNVRGRLRGYNRSLLPKTAIPPSLPFRLVHRMIGETVEAGGTVDVWIHLHGPDSRDTVEAMEATWIREKCPDWNVHGIPRVR